MAAKVIAEANAEGGFTRVPLFLSLSFTVALYGSQETA